MTAKRYKVKKAFNTPAERQANAGRLGGFTGQDIQWPDLEKHRGIRPPNHMKADSPYADEVMVFLDGEELFTCLEANVREGWVKMYAEDYSIIRKEGKVELKWRRKDE